MRSTRLWLILLASLVTLAIGAAGYIYWRDLQANEENRIAGMNFEDVWSAYEAGQYRTAFKGAHQLAGGGSTPAQVLLGRMYNQGHGTPVDHTQALNWYLRAADSEHPEAMAAVINYYHLGTGLQRRNSFGAAHWAERLAEMGSAWAQTYIGRAYINGSGVAKNPERGFEWLHRAADAGDNEAMSMLAQAYSTGAFGERDYENALHWYLASARFGDVMSMRSVVRILANESRSVFDLEKAYFWALVGVEWAGERSINPRFLEPDILEILYHVPNDFRSRSRLRVVDASGLRGGDPPPDPTPADFNYESWPRRLDPEAQGRVEAEVRDFLERFPEPPMTM